MLMSLHVLGMCPRDFNNDSTDLKKNNDSTAKRICRCVLAAIV
jgi:hypothetical protein